MLKRLLTGVFAVVGASSLAGAAQAATPSYTTTNVNLRAGPGSTYPVLVTVPVGRAITTYGCLEEYNWCDVSWGAERGWMSASYIQFTFEGQPVYVNPAIAPALGLTVVIYDRAYWDRWYFGRPWYANWDRYYRPPPPRPPRAGPGPRPPKSGPGPGPRPPQMVQPIQPPRSPQAGNPRPRAKNPVQPDRPRANRPRPNRPQMSQPVQPRPPKTNNPRPNRPTVLQPVQPRQQKAGDPRGDRQDAGIPRNTRQKASSPRGNRQNAGNARNRGGNASAQNRSRRNR